MQEIAGTVYVCLGDALNELGKDVELNPKEFLGFALYPEQLWSWFVTLLTFGFAMAQKKLVMDN